MNEFTRNAPISLPFPILSISTFLLSLSRCFLPMCFPTPVLLSLSQILEFVREFIPSSVSPRFLFVPSSTKMEKERFVPSFQSSTCCSIRVEHCAPQPSETPDPSPDGISEDLPSFSLSLFPRFHRALASLTAAFPCGINVLVSILLYNGLRVPLSLLR